ncbi:hypothetical protein JTE90_014918 [Oedothorax gibbosus]|uniref:Uncharacterized protein n=1 Tax=Oedothorax gibbosus TaxID=931172 RepID=A0AAV6VNY8_9ARAC|nr:hypothetical protein JTE90_014918 [Oedothorax gibbosus]
MRSFPFTKRSPAWEAMLENSSGTVENPSGPPPPSLRHLWHLLSCYSADDHGKARQVWMRVKLPKCGGASVERLTRAPFGFNCSEVER